jgi:hypothetical protein
MDPPAEKDIDQKLKEIKKKISQDFSDILDSGFNKFIDDLSYSSK